MDFVGFTNSKFWEQMVVNIVNRGVSDVKHGKKQKTGIVRIGTQNLETDSF